ncbi:hypothetical protein, partial [Shigella sonnei]
KNLKDSANIIKDFFRSKHYISEIREKLHPLSAEELNLLSLIINS